MHPGVALQPSPPLTAARSPCTPSRHDSLFLWGAFTVNVTGSLVLGVLVGAANAVLGTVMDLLGAGLWGALTVYSMFGFERIRLVEDRAPVLRGRQRHRQHRRPASALHSSAPVWPRRSGPERAPPRLTAGDRLAR